MNGGELPFDDKVQEFMARKALATAVLQQQQQENNGDHFDRSLTITNLSCVSWNLKQWRKLLPRVQPYYAVKCNDDPEIMKLLARLSCGFDIASTREIEKVIQAWEGSEKLDKETLRQGLREKTIFANPCKSVSNLRAARDAGVDMMTFDNASELRKIKEHFPEARLVLRILPPAAHAVISFGEKFGADESEAVSLMSLAKSLQLNIVGLSFHVGTGCGEADAFARAVYDAKPLFDHLKELFPEANLLDIGGGFPGGGTNWDEASADTIKFEEICHHLTVALDECFPASSGVNLIAEPGRYMVASAVSVAVNVIAKRASTGGNQTQEDPDSNVDPILYYVNDGIYGMFSCVLYENTVYQPWPLTKPQNDGKTSIKSTIFGPTCCGLDKIGHNYKLPEMQIGDWLLFHHVGAYSSTVMTDFNSMVQSQRLYMFTCRTDRMAKTRGQNIVFWTDGQDITTKSISAEEINAELESAQCSPLLVRDNNSKLLQEYFPTIPTGSKSVSGIQARLAHKMQHEKSCASCMYLTKMEGCQTTEEMIKKIGYAEVIATHVNMEERRG